MTGRRSPRPHFSRVKEPIPVTVAAALGSISAPDFASHGALIILASIRGGRSLIEVAKILLITGPAGVGKSTLNWEVSAKLTAAGLRHAAIETDELDRIFPLPSASELEGLRVGMTDISEINLASIWGNYRALGCERLILSGVMVFLDETRKWISRAIPNAEFTIIRLLASNETLLRRLQKREIGPGMEDQVRRTLRQADQIATIGGAGAMELKTDGKAPQELASELLNQIGWLTNHSRF
jgi:hypothetical protein